MGTLESLHRASYGLTRKRPSDKQKEFLKGFAEGLVDDNNHRLRRDRVIAGDAQPDLGLLLQQPGSAKYADGKDMDLNEQLCLIATDLNRHLKAVLEPGRTTANVVNPATSATEEERAYVELLRSSDRIPHWKDRGLLSQENQEHILQLFGYYCNPTNEPMGHRPQVQGLFQAHQDASLVRVSSEAFKIGLFGTHWRHPAFELLVNFSDFDSSRQVSYSDMSMHMSRYRCLYACPNTPVYMHAYVHVYTHVYTHPPGVIF